MANMTFHSSRDIYCNGVLYFLSQRHLVSLNTLSNIISYKANTISPRRWSVYDD